MKQLNYLLAAFLLLLMSCSGAKYSYREKVKVEKQSLSHRNSSLSGKFENLPSLRSDELRQEEITASSSTINLPDPEVIKEGSIKASPTSKQKLEKPPHPIKRKPFLKEEKKIRHENIDPADVFGVLSLVLGIIGVGILLSPLIFPLVFLSLNLIISSLAFALAAIVFGFISVLISKGSSPVGNSFGFAGIFLGVGLIVVFLVLLLLLAVLLSVVWV